MITLNRKSWHYWIASNLGDIEDDEITNICTYLRHIIKGLFVGTIAGLFASLLTFFLTTAAYHYLGVLLGIVHRDATKYEQVGGGIFIVTAIVAAIILIAVKVQNFMEYAKTEKDVGFVRTAYRSFKEKTCILINFKD